MICLGRGCGCKACRREFIELEHRRLVLLKAIHTIAVRRGMSA